MMDFSHIYSNGVDPVLQITQHQSLMIKRLGARIRARRAELGLSQDGLAERCGFHRNTIGRIEKAMTAADLSLSEILVIAYCLELPLTDLAGPRPWMENLMSEKAVWDSVDRIIHTTVTTPAIRTLLIELDLDGSGAFEARILPVQAFTRNVRRSYSKRILPDQPRRAPATHEEAIDDNWSFQSEGITLGVIVVGFENPGQLEERTLDDINQEAPEFLTELVVADWPSSEDAKRLAPVIEEMKGRLQDKIRQHTEIHGPRPKLSAAKSKNKQMGDKP